MALTGAKKVRRVTLFSAIKQLRVCNLLHHVTDEALEGFVLDELLVELGEVLHGALRRFAQGLIVGQSGGMRCVGLRV